MQIESRISLSKFQKWIEKASIDRWLAHSGDKDWSIGNLEPDNKVKVYGQWMVIILLYSPELKGTFKLFYNNSDFDQILANDSKDEALVRDFTKEYCNLIAGAIQKIFEAYHIRVGISLPVITRGFDTYSEPARHEQMGSIMWSIEKADKRFICQFNLEIFGEESLEKLKDEPEFDLDIKNGIVEFL